MALRAVNFRIRALTSLVFVAVMLLGLLWNQWSFFVLISIIHFGCWFEYQKLLSKIDPAYQEISAFQKYGVMVAGWCIMMYSSKEGYATDDFSLHNAGLYGCIIFLFILPDDEVDHRITIVAYPIEENDRFRVVHGAKVEEGFGLNSFEFRGRSFSLRGIPPVWRD